MRAKVSQSAMVARRFSGNSGARVKAHLAIYLLLIAAHPRLSEVDPLP